MKIIQKQSVLFAIIFYVSLLVTSSASAFTITKTEEVNNNDFVLDQSKVELGMNPGESKRVQMAFTNRTKITRDFEIFTEDISGSKNGTDAVVLLGEATGGQFSAKNFIVPELRSFKLQPGEKITLTVDVNLPKNMEPGGKYASVIFGSKSTGNGEVSKTVSRLASLFLIDVSGNSKKEGYLSAFSPKDKFIFDESANSLFIGFQNTGNSHLDPYGKITVSSLLGQPVEEIEVKPFYALPDSLRNRITEWNPTFSFWIYKVTLDLNRGYDNLVDSKSFYIFAFSWKIAIAILIVLVFLFMINKFLISKVNISFKK